MYGLGVDSQPVVETTALGRKRVVITGWGFPSDAGSVMKSVEGLDYDIVSSSYNSIVIETHSVGESAMDIEWEINLNWNGPIQFGPELNGRYQ